MNFPFTFTCWQLCKWNFGANTINYWQFFCWVGVTTVYLAAENWKANRNWMDKLGLDFENVQNFFLTKNLPQVPEFFFVCLVCPTCAYCCRHWTRHNSPKGDGNNRNTCAMVFLLKWPKRSTFQYELWIWHICPPDRYCVSAQNWKYCKSVNIVENNCKKFAKTVKFDTNFCFLESASFREF